MPIYEYRCETCSHPFEALVFGSEQPSCPACGSQRLARRLSTFAVGHRAPGPAPCEAQGECPYACEGGRCAAEE